jgi:hypothetical protein
MTSLAGPKWIREASKRVVAFLPCEDWIVIGWVVAIKVLLFVIGVKSYPILWDKYPPTPDRWFALWDQWDFGYYQKIAEFGYEANDGSLAFYPLFPWLVEQAIRLCRCKPSRFPVGTREPFRRISLPMRAMRLAGGVLFGAFATRQRRGYDKAPHALRQDGVQTR